MQKYGFVYIWRDRKRKMYYVGCHWGTENDGYICSSNRMRDAYRRRPKDFKRRIVEIVKEKTLLYDIEYKWLSMINESELGNKYYNLRKHKWGHWSTDEISSLSIKQKVSNTKKEYWNSPVSENNRKMLSELNKSKGIQPPSRKGKIPWNKGLTKESDPRVLANAVAVSKPKSNTEKMGKYKRHGKNEKSK